MTFSMNPTQFAAVTAKLKAAPHDQIKSFTSDGVQGVINTDLVSLGYHYDGVDTLFVSVTAHHWLARFVSDNTIQSHIADLLASAE